MAELSLVRVGGCCLLVGIGVAVTPVCVESCLKLTQTVAVVAAAELNFQVCSAFFDEYVCCFC